VKMSPTTISFFLTIALLFLFKNYTQQKGKKEA
jgi:hypothetical protein